MRVLQVINTLEPAGAETFLRDLTLGLARRGIEPTVYLLHSTGSALERSLGEAGIPLHCSPAGPVRSPRHVLALARPLAAHAYDVVHAHLFPSQLWGALAVRLGDIRTPLLTTEHSTRNRRRRLVYKVLDKWMYGHYAHVVCVSNAAAEALARWIPATAPRLLVIENGIDASRLDGAPRGDRKAVLGFDGPVVMMVGRFEPARDPVWTGRRGGTAGPYSGATGRSC